MPDLSIIIITLNNRPILSKCIDSIKKHTKIPFEIIVTDNGSTDGTLEMVKNEHPEIKLIENGQNLGFSAANNKGLRIANGRYSALLNDDTYITDDAFSMIIKYMDGDPKAGICGPKLLNPDGSLQKQGSFLSSYKWRAKNPKEVGFVIGACLLIRMSIISKVGLLDENLFFYNDDLDLCKRVKKAGFLVMYYPQASVFHYGGLSSKKSMDYSHIIEGMRGGLYFCKKHYGNTAYSLYRALMLFMILAALPFSVFDRTKLTAYLKLLSIILRGEIVSKISSL